MTNNNYNNRGAPDLLDPFDERNPYRFEMLERRNREINQWTAEAFARGELTEEKINAGWRINGVNELVPPPNYQPEPLPDDRPVGLFRQRAYTPGLDLHLDNRVNQGIAEYRARMLADQNAVNLRSYVGEHPAATSESSSDSDDESGSDSRRDSDDESGSDSEG